MLLKKKAVQQKSRRLKLLSVTVSFTETLYAHTGLTEQLLINRSFLFSLFIFRAVVVVAKADW